MVEPAPDVKKTAAEVKKAEANTQPGAQPPAEVLHDAWVQAARAGQGKQFRQGMVDQLGESKVTQLELSWAKLHADLFPHPGKGSSHPENIDAAAIKNGSWNPKASDKAEAEFERDVGQRLVDYVKNERYFWQGWGISPRQLDAQIQKLGTQSAIETGTPKIENQISQGLSQPGPGGQSLLSILSDGHTGQGFFPGDISQLQKQLADGSYKGPQLSEDQRNLVKNLANFYDNKPITIDGKTVNPGEPGYEAMKKALDDFKTGSQLYDYGAPGGQTGYSAATIRERAERAAEPPPQAPPAPAETEQTKKDAALIAGSLHSGAVPMSDLGMKNPNDPIKRDAVDAAYTKLQEMKDKDPNSLNEGQKKELETLGLLRQHWDEISSKDNPKEITSPQMQAWAQANGTEFRGVGQPGPVTRPVEDPAALSEAQKQQLDKFQFNATDRQASPARGQSLYQFWQSQAPPGSTPEQVRAFAKEMGKANGLVTPKNEAYWNAYVKTGDYHHLPAAAGQFFDSHKPWKVPGADIEQQKKQAAEAAVGPATQQIKLTDQDAKKVSDLFNQYYHKWPFGTPRPTDPREQAVALNEALKRQGGIGKLRGYQAVAEAINAAQKLHEEQMRNALKYIDGNLGT